MASKYYKVYTAVKPFAKIAGQKTVGTIKYAAKKAKQAKAKLSFKRRALSKAAAAGEDTSKLAAEIAELEAIIAK